jgi:undecaprenyl-diphosphatase
MKLKWQLTGAFSIALGFAILFALVSLLVGEHKLAQFDDSIIAFFRGWESTSMTSVMKFFTLIGSGTVVPILSVVVMVFLYKVLHHRAELILFLGVVAGEAILNVVLKTLFHRARPELHRLAEATGYSFPSGHSMTAFAFYGIVAFLLWRHLRTSFGRTLLIIFSIVMTLLIGISRIYLGVHYPSDVLGGYLASGFWLTVSIWVFQRYKEKRYERQALQRE